MKIETVKSYILFILVLISLLLTFALWNYKPNYSTKKGDPDYLNEIDLGGTEETKRSIIQPSNIVFHKKDTYYGFDDPEVQQIFYTRMQDWTFDDFKSGQLRGLSLDRNFIEIIFPSDMPIEVANVLFKLNTYDELPNWSFNRMRIMFNQANSTLEVKFISIDNQQQATFTIKDSSVFKNVWSYIVSEKNQREYVAFNLEDSPIYIPKEEVEAKSKAVSVHGISVSLLVDALFYDPSVVNPNSPDDYLSDGQRRIKLLEDRRAMEFAHPMHSSSDRSNVIELLDRSLGNINSHRGWTDRYYLETIDQRTNLLRYRMKYDGYPVFNSSDLSIIETELINLELRAYRRPLFSLVNELSSKDVTLLSGKEIVYFLTDNEIFKKENIRDIQIGYKLTYSDLVSHTLTLDPAWYINYNGSWIEIRSDQLEDSITGGR